MNILICNDDGPKAFGLKVLTETVKQEWPNAKVVTMTTKQPHSGAAMAVRVPQTDVTVEKKEPGFFIVDGMPADIIYQAFTHTEQYLATGSFDLVCAGINHGQNVGWDILHSGTVGMAALAANIWGAAAFSFSQRFPREIMDKQRLSTEEQKLFRQATRLIPQFLSQNKADPGVVINVNFPDPTLKLLGWRQCMLAPAWSQRDLEPECQGQRVTMQLDYDTVALAKGYVTIAEVELRFTPPVRY